MEQPRPPRGAPGAGEPGRPPPVPPDVRFVTEESFDFGVLSPSDRWGGTGSPIDGDRGMRMRPMPRGAAGGAGARCGARAWRSWCGRPRAWPRSCSAAACPPPAAPPAPQSPRTPRSPRRETFVVKDSPVRALLPTVNARDPPATPRAPDKPRGAPAGAPACPTPCSLPSPAEGEGRPPPSPPAPQQDPGPPRPLGPPTPLQHPAPGWCCWGGGQCVAPPHASVSPSGLSPLQEHRGGPPQRPAPAANRGPPPAASPRGDPPAARGTLRHGGGVSPPQGRGRGSGRILL
uniref:Uncharacterized protein n=1 Tax=Strigops habroptila TaxID=2489341 RepID=A0A672UNU3_STRHB